MARRSRSGDSAVALITEIGSQFPRLRTAPAFERLRQRAKARAVRGGAFDESVDAERRRFERLLLAEADASGAAAAVLGLRRFFRGHPLDCLRDPTPENLDEFEAWPRWSDFGGMPDGATEAYVERLWPHLDELRALLHDRPVGLIRLFLATYCSLSVGGPRSVAQERLALEIPSALARAEELDARIRTETWARLVELAESRYVEYATFAGEFVALDRASRARMDGPRSQLERAVPRLRDATPLTAQDAFLSARDALGSRAQTLLVLAQEARETARGSSYGPVPAISVPYGVELWTGRGRFQLALAAAGAVESPEAILEEMWSLLAALQRAAQTLQFKFVTGAWIFAECVGQAAAAGALARPSQWTRRMTSLAERVRGASSSSPRRAYEDRYVRRIADVAAHLVAAR